MNEESWLEESSDGRTWDLVPMGFAASKRFVRRSYKRTHTTVESTRPEDRGEQFAVPPKPPVFRVVDAPTADIVRTHLGWFVKSDEVQIRVDSSKYGYFTSEANAIEWCEYLNRTRGVAK
jgi:hypothetical protein